MRGGVGSGGWGDDVSLFFSPFCPFIEGFLMCKVQRIVANNHGWPRLAKLFNGTVNTVRQVEVEKWIKARYPTIWAGLETKGFVMRYNNTRALALDVKMEP